MLVADVAWASRQVDDLARLVLLGRVERAVPESRREPLLLLARFGAERLHQLVDGMTAAPDREYERCGACLSDATERLDADVVGRAHHPALPCCAALGTTILQASRNARRAYWKFDGGYTTV